MKRVNFLVVLIILTLAALSSNAQLVRDLHYLYNPSYFYNPQNTKSDTANFSPFSNFKPGETKYNFEVGTSYSSFAGGLSNSYISPSVSYRASERLFIVAGGKFSHATATNPQLFSNFNQVTQQNSMGNPAEAYAYGHFQVNEKLSIYGMGAFGKNQIYMSPFGSGFGQADYQHFSVGMDYKISDKTSIGASFGVSNGPAWGISPFGGYGRSGFSPFMP